MRKLLLATSAIVGVAFSGAANAAGTSPISLNVGGYTDFVAGFYHQSDAATGVKSVGHDFESEFKLLVDAMGKASNGVEYGATVALTNASEGSNYWADGTDAVKVDDAYVWLSGAFGKVLLGDAQGASDLAVYAPTVGEGQFDGRYRDFVTSTTLAYIQATGTDNTEGSTKITYYTPKVGNEAHKVQLGVSYAPSLNNEGQSVVQAQTGAAYRDVVKSALQYTGKFSPVAVSASFTMDSGSGNNGVSVTNNSTTTATGNFKDFTTWGLGAQAAYAGFTVGASYVDMGSYGALTGQNKDQDVYTVGGKYEFDKVGVALSYLTGEGYANYLTGANKYVESQDVYSAGATYTWFPGMSSNADLVFFNQEVTRAQDNDGYVFLLSQKLAF